MVVQEEERGPLIWASGVTVATVGFYPPGVGSTPTGLTKELFTHQVDSKDMADEENVQEGPLKRALKWFFSPRILLINGAIQLIGWTIMMFVAQFTDLGDAVKYVTAISHFALILNALGLIQTALVDKKADERDPNVSA
jgi:hypothetical protein